MPCTQVCNGVGANLGHPLLGVLSQFILGLALTKLCGILLHGRDMVGLSVYLRTLNYHNHLIW